MTKCAEHGTYDEIAYASCPICEIVGGSERLPYDFNIVAGADSESKRVEGTVVVSRMSDDDAKWVLHELDALAVRIYEKLSGQKGPTR